MRRGCNVPRALVRRLRRTARVAATRLRSGRADGLVAQRVEQRRLHQPSHVQRRLRELSDLGGTLGRTRTHYGRGIKPNASKSAAAFGMGRVVAQLRCAGVIACRDRARP